MAVPDNVSASRTLRGLDIYPGIYVRGLSDVLRTWRRNAMITTDNAIKIMAQAEALHDLYNWFGRFKVTEEQWIALYLEDKLGDFIKKQIEEEEAAEL